MPDALRSISSIETTARLPISRTTRLMVVAPHPDDEALACGVLLQRIVRAGGAVRVLYVTDGDNNPWPQRVLERKWLLGRRDRQRWGRLRRLEATAALRAIGVSRRNSEFLHWPDQGLTELLMRQCNVCVDTLHDAIAGWAPTLLLAPAITDTHADHNAVGVMLRIVQQNLQSYLPALRVWSYTVHGRSATFLRDAEALRYTPAEMATKLSAIRCHKTQIALSRRRFTAYARREERFRELTIRESVIGASPILSVSKRPTAIALNVRLPFRPFPRESDLLIAATDPLSKQQRCLRAQLPARSAELILIDCATGGSVAALPFRGNAFAGEVLIPNSLFSRACPLFVKVDPRSGFGRTTWLEINPSPRRAVELSFARKTTAIDSRDMPAPFGRIA